MKAKFATEGVYTPDALIAGNAHLLLAKKVTIASGQTLARGAVLGKVSASGEYTLSASAAVDGSETPDCVLAENVDASAAATAAMVYTRGDFAAAALTFGTGHSAASAAEALRGKGIALLPIAS